MEGNEISRNFVLS